MTIDEILSAAINAAVSDVHLQATSPCRWRVNGHIKSIPATAPLAADTITDWHQSLRPGTPFNGDDFSVQRAGRVWRVNACLSSAGPKLTLRLVPSVIPALETIGLPAKYISELDRLRGFHLVTGPTGSGKSTTLAAIIQRLSERPINIVTLEDPIEYRHSCDCSALITQRELGVHFQSFADDALRGALRQDPDVILFGELRDRASVRAALTAAETGHMVLATLHNDTAADAVSRILDACADDAKTEHAAQVSKQLGTVLAQRLVRTRDDKRVAAIEYMNVTPAVRTIIRQGHDSKLPDEIERGANHGMVSLSRSLAELVRSRIVLRDEARLHAPNLQIFDTYCPA